VPQLRAKADLKWTVLGELCRCGHKQRYVLEEWSEAVSWLLGCEVQFESYEQIGQSLKPFSMKMR